jgi:hypothetical protein
MLNTTRNRKFHWLGTTAIAALTLAAMSVPLTPAKAYTGVDVGPVGIGVGGPYYGPGPYYYGPYHRYYGYYGPGPYSPGYYGW